MTKPFDPNKPFRTRCGWKAQLMCDDLIGSYPILVKITTPLGEKIPRTYQKDGRFMSHDSEADLINIPERIQRRVWLNVYADVCLVYEEKNLADSENFSEKLLACIPIDIDCEVGEGL